MVTVADVRQMVTQAVQAASSHPFFVNHEQLSVLQEIQARLSQDGPFTVEDVAQGASVR